MNQILIKNIPDDVCAALNRLAAEEQISRHEMLRRMVVEKGQRKIDWDKAIDELAANGEWIAKTASKSEGFEIIYNGEQERHKKAPAYLFTLNGNPFNGTSIMILELSLPALLKRIDEKRIEFSK